MSMINIYIHVYPLDRAGQTKTHSAEVVLQSPSQPEHQKTPKIPRHPNSVGLPHIQYT
jgi:hypothetical protein